jgi:DNA-binding transcriptional LysR family regulator
LERFNKLNYAINSLAAEINASIRELRAFLAIARLGSFTRAADKIFLTQAGLSLMLKNLATQVSARLSTERPAACGSLWQEKSLLPTARRMMADWKSATSSLERLAAEAEQPISLAGNAADRVERASPVVAGWLCPGAVVRQ